MKIIEDRPFFPWGCKLYPSGEFVLFRKNRRKKREQEESIASAGSWLFRGSNLLLLLQVWSADAVYRWWNAAARVGVPEVSSGARGTIVPAVDGGVMGERSLLGLSALANSKKRPRGSGGLTTLGKVLVREGAAELERRYGRQHLAFWTCTLPPMPREDLESVCRNWSAILHNVRLKLQYHLEQSGLPPHIVGVTELQTSRYEREGRPCWHIHWVFVGRRPYRHWALSISLLDSLWKDAVQSYMKSTAVWSSTSNVQRVKKTVSGYLSKYLTKGSGLIARVQEEWPSCIPSSWYTCTLGIRRHIRRNTRQSENTARYVHQRLLDDIKSIVAPYAYRMPTVHGQSSVVCWLGRLPDCAGVRYELDSPEDCPF